MTINYAYFDQFELEPPLFWPHGDDSSPPVGAFDYLVPVADGAVVGARYYLASREFPTILYFHGNGEVAGDHDEIAPLYHDVGLNLFVAEFRGYGKSTGTPTVASLILDARPIAARFRDIVAEHGANQVSYLMGRSLGSQPALELASAHGDLFQGLILESPAAKLTRLFGRMPPGAVSEERRRELTAAHEAKISRVRLPTLILHGERDDLIPLADAEHIQQLISGSELVVIRGAGHNDILFRGLHDYFGAIRRFVAAHG